MKGIFLKCSSLSSLPDISKWSYKMTGLFAPCENLILSKQVLKTINFQTEDYNERENEDESIICIW